MQSASSSTASLSILFQEVRDGTPGSRNALLTALRQNLTRLTAAILRQFPIVEQRREVDSLYQQLNEKLIGAMDAGVQPENPTEFIKFAAFRLRQMLKDEADKIRRRGTPAHFADPNHSSVGGAPPPAAVEDSASVMLQWDDFQNKIQALGDTERLVFDLHFHMQLPQSEVAELLAMPAKAVSRTWLAVASKLKGAIPKVTAPPGVLIVSGGVAFTGPATAKLFEGWRAFRVRAVGGAENGLPLSATAVEWADVVCVTRPEYEATVRRCSALGKTPVVCLDVPDEFDPTDKAQVDRLWERLTKRVET